MKTNLKLHLGMAGLLLWSSAHCAVAADDVNFNTGNRDGLHLELYSQRDSKGPQLVLDFAARPGNYRPFEAAHWSQTPRTRMLDQGLLQVAVRLQF